MINPLISLFYDLHTVKEDIPVTDFIQAIKTGTLRDRNFADLITEIRNEPDKDKKDALKKTLPAVTLSSTFNERRKTGNISSYTGLLQIDIDDLPAGYNNFAELREKIIKDKYTFICFTSPSGKLKLVVQIPQTPEKHKEVFLALENYYQAHYSVK